MIYLKEHIYDCLIWFAGLQSEQNHQGRSSGMFYIQEFKDHAMPTPHHPPSAEAPLPV